MRGSTLFWWRKHRRIKLSCLSKPERVEIRRTRSNGQRTRRTLDPTDTRSDGLAAPADLFRGDPTGSSAERVLPRENSYNCNFFGQTGGATVHLWTVFLLGWTIFAWQCLASRQIRSSRKNGTSGLAALKVWWPQLLRHHQ